MRNNKGITLTSLIVTIIVMVILAGIALLFSVGDSGVISRAEKTKFLEDMKLYKEELELYKAEKQIENQKSGVALNTGIGNGFTEWNHSVIVGNKYIPSMKIEYAGIIGILDGELAYMKARMTSEEEKMAIAAGLIVEENKDVEYNAPEEVVGSEVKSGLWQYIKNESGTLTITQYLGTTTEELTDVVVPNRINGQVVEYFDGFGKNLTGTLTISKGLKTSGSSTRANVSANKLILEEDVVIQNNAFFNGSKLNIVEIKKNVILNAQQIFSWVNIENMQIGKNVQILNNAFFWSKIKELNIEENCKIETTISNTQKIKIGDNAKININVTETLEELTIGNNAIMNGFSGATSLKNINIGENCSLRGENLFADCSSITDNDVYNILKNSIEIQAFGLFSNCDSLVNVIIPANKTISRISKAGNERYMFQGCDNVNSLTIKENCIFNDATFYYCNFKNLIIEDNVKFVSGYAFGGSKELNNVKIGKNCLIKGMVFNYCSNIENVIIDVQTEGSGASFNGCTSIKNVEYYLTEEQKNLCKENLDNVNKIINSNEMFKTIINNNTLTVTFEEDKIILKNVES